MATPPDLEAEMQRYRENYRRGFIGAAWAAFIGFAVISFMAGGALGFVLGDVTAGFTGKLACEQWRTR